MLSQSLDTLLTLAEIAITLAGFSAIVVVFKRSADGLWRQSDADRFHGMMLHALFAVLFCLLPMLVNVVVQDSVATFRLCCVLIGIQIVIHTLGIMRLPTTGRWAKGLISLGLAVGALQFSVFSAWGVQREVEVYQFGIVWHILHAGYLFTALIAIPKLQIDENEG